jgi:Arc/MetJ-type ribon-helix-helix transcriptional regulator
MPERTTTIRLTEQDQKVIDELQEFTGIQSVTELIRLALRELARQNGVAEFGASNIIKRLRQGGTRPKPKK